MEYQDQFKKIDEFVENQRTKNNIPALAIGIVNGKETMYQKGFGKADSEGRLVTPQTPFLLGSVSKSFTALAIMQLVDAGKIELDQSTDLYLPWFKATYEGKNQKITIRQLLHHTSGIRSFYAASVADHTTLDQLVRERLNNMPLKALPGTKSVYSNANYIILGRIIQEVSGMAFQEYIVKNIFEPLEMKHSYVTKADALKNNLADGYRKWFGLPVKTVAKDVSFFEYSLPEGYLISCLEDMTHYVSALINQGRYGTITIASQESINMLLILR
jgi:CubicO group peptidase (beta-lactamase class C family)